MTRRNILRPRNGNAARDRACIRFPTAYRFAMALKNKTAAERKSEAEMYNFASTAGGGAMALPYHTDRQIINLKQTASNDRAARSQPFNNNQE